MHDHSDATPLMQQFFAIKKEYPDGLLFFQVGDFYELFFEDAHKAAAFLAITLTSRGKNKGEPIPLCGVPVHAKDHYINKLVKGGFSVVVCDQIEPAQTGKIVGRAVKQVLTPGTLTDAHHLSAHSASYSSVLVVDHNRVLLLYAELLRGSIWVSVIHDHTYKLIEQELSRFIPDELIMTPKALELYGVLLKKQGYCVSVSQLLFDKHHMALWKKAHAIKTPDSYQALFDEALQLLFGYLEKNKQLSLTHFNQVVWYKSNDFLIIDSATQKNLELIKNNQDNTQSNTLLSTLNNTLSSMGSRMLKKWLLKPLVHAQRLEQRYEVVQLFLDDLGLAHATKKLIEQCPDAERSLGRMALGRAALQDYQSLLIFIPLLRQIKELFAHSSPALIKKLLHAIDLFDALEDFLSKAFVIHPTQGLLIQQGFDYALDQARFAQQHSTELILKLESKERTATSINTLKIHYTAIHGYAFEVTKTHISKIPSNYIRMQTLVGKERYTTKELQALETTLNQASAQLQDLELKAFEHIKEYIAPFIPSLLRACSAVSTFDVLWSFFSSAYHHHYTRPQLSDTSMLEVIQGRHPVVERILDTPFVPNDIILNNAHQVLIITGPNMGGKSTYLRQTALICIMAQIGSFVPASSAKLSLKDRIFTRIGASDNMSAGKSTFLVEMEETAFICTQATNRSLVIFDEVGRGTSTFDGLSIAQAVVEYTHSHIGAHTLFATHYHELTELTQHNPAIDCLYAESTTHQDTFHLTFRIKKGVAQGSFGLEAAKTAGLPEWIINRAKELWQHY